MNLRTFIVLFSFFVGKVCFSQALFEQKVEDLQAHPLMKGALLGIVVFDERNDSALFKLNEDIAMVPASTLKLVTSAAALEILGPAYRFNTRLAISGKINSHTETLDGSLSIIGGGDPALGSEYFKENYFNPDFIDSWVYSIIRHGIKRIDGNIYIDESIYDGQDVPDTWIWEDIGNYYGAGARGISVFDNMFRITFRSGKRAGRPTEIIKVDPWAEWLEFENYVVSSDKNSDNAYVYGDPWGNLRKIRGTIPKKRDSFQIKASLPEPGLVLGELLKSKLESKNIPVSGQVKKGNAVEKADKYFEIWSPELSKIIKVLNHESVNLFAEHLVKQIAYEKTGVGSTEKGLEIIKKFWAGKGIDTSAMFLEDGSGLSHFNAISPKQLVEVLQFMKTKSRNFEFLKASLPAAGEGTLYYFGPDNFRGGSLRCKSGSMTRVRCFAGYLVTSSDEELIFAVMVNNFSMKQGELINYLESCLKILREN